MHARLMQRSEWPAFDQMAARVGTLFNRTEWLSVFGPNVQIVGFFEENGQLSGGMCLYAERRFGMPILRNLPFTPTNGPIMETKAQNPVAILDARRKALECAAEYLDQQGAAVIRLILDRHISDVLPFYWRGFKAIPRYTYLINLSGSLDSIRKNMSAVRRNDISKAARDGLIVRQSSDMRVVQDLVLSTFERQDMSINRSVLEAILFRYSNGGNSFAFTTYRKDTPIATSFMVHDSQTAYYLLGGYSAEDRHHGAGAMAVFEAIKHSQEIGLRTFDFEGSVVPAIERYFRGFGGQLTPYFSINKAWLPLEMAIKVRRRNIF